MLYANENDILAAWLETAWHLHHPDGERRALGAPSDPALYYNPETERFEIHSGAYPPATFRPAVRSMDMPSANVARYIGGRAPWRWTDHASAGAFAEALLPRVRGARREALLDILRAAIRAGEQAWTEAGGEPAKRPAPRALDGAATE